VAFTCSLRVEAAAGVSKYARLCVSDLGGPALHVRRIPFAYRSECFCVPGNAIGPARFFQKATAEQEGLCAFTTSAAWSRRRRRHAASRSWLAVAQWTNATGRPLRSAQVNVKRSI
jgi:hypothetical protein